MKLTTTIVFALDASALDAADGVLRAAGFATERPTPAADCATGMPARLAATVVRDLDGHDPAVHDADQDLAVRVLTEASIAHARIGGSRSYDAGE